MALSTVPKPAHGPALEGYPTGHLCPGSSKRTGYPGAFWPKVLFNTETDKEGNSEEVKTGSLSSQDPQTQGGMSGLLSLMPSSYLRGDKNGTGFLMGNSGARWGSVPLFFPRSFMELREDISRQTDFLLEGGSPGPREHSSVKGTTLR